MFGVLSLMLFLRPPLGAASAASSTINENFAAGGASKQNSAAGGASKHNFAAGGASKQQQLQVIRAPQALAVIRNGSVVGVKLLSAPELVSPTFYNVILTQGTHSNQASARDSKVRWNKDSTFTVIDPGSGYITPPIVNFIPKNLTDNTKEKGKKKKKTGGPAAEGSDTVLKITPSGMWEDIPQNEKDALAEVTQDYLREQKYSGSVLENMYTQGVLSRISDTSYSVEWMFPIEFSMLVLNYNQLSPRVKLIKVVGYNENGVELFSQDLIYMARIEWRYRALLKKLVVSGAPRWDSMEVWGRRVFWTCEEYQDFVEQLKESTDKPGTPSSQYEDDDTTVLYSEVLEQVPPDFRDKTKSEYIDYYSTMVSHCNRKTKEQQDAEKLVEDQEIANYQKMIQESQEKTSLYKEKLMRDYQRMQEQYALDEIDRRDAEKYGISPPEFKYSKEEIESLRKRIESIKNVPEEKLLRDCSRLEKTYNKQRKSAEKWAKAGIFLPFLKKKAKRESKKAEKSENRYQENCAELVALSYSY